MPEWNFSGVEEYTRRSQAPASEPQRGTATSGDLGETLRGLLPVEQWVKDRLSPAYGAMRDIGTGYRERFAEPVTNATSEAFQALPFGIGPETSQSLARFVVPQTPMGAGIALGGAASAGLGAFPGIMGAAAGGLIGGGLGETAAPHTGAGLGALSGLVGQGLGYLGGVVRRRFGQQAADEADLGRAVGEISPTLGTTTTATEMQDRLKGAAGPEALSAAYRASRGAVASGAEGQVLQAPEGSALNQLTGKEAVSFDEAATAIEQLRAGTHTLLGALKGGEKAALQRTLRAQAVDETTSGLRVIDPALATMFRDAERAYGTGWELLRLFSAKGVLDPATRGLNMPKLQALAGERQRSLERMLGPAGWATLEREIYRGGHPPAMDYERGMGLPFRLYTGPMSEGFRVPLPKSYVGPDQLGFPAWPLTAGAGVAVPNLLNPYAGRR